jgi:hypothetical protein
VPPSPNPLQAVLDRQLPKETPAPAAPAAPAPAEPGPAPAKFHRPVRDGRRFMGGHFDPNVLKQMKWLAVEEDTTTQKLLEEAIDLLFIKKGRGKIIGR